MSTSFSAHYDGRVIVPDQPVSLPIGQKLNLRVESAELRGSVQPASDAGTHHQLENELGLREREAWLADFDAWIASQRSHNPHFDDSRESIYPDRS